jgi:hypothetical protein
MILFAEEYHDSESDTHSPYVVAFQKLNNPKKKTPLKLKTGQKPYIMQPIEIQAIAVARCLVRLLDLDMDREYAFRPLPWMDPGERIEVGADTIQELYNVLPVDM